jgi:hypothetical protein
MEWGGIREYIRSVQKEQAHFVPFPDDFSELCTHIGVVTNRWYENSVVMTLMDAGLWINGG